MKGRYETDIDDLWSALTDDSAWPGGMRRSIPWTCSAHTELDGRRTWRTSRLILPDRKARTGLERGTPDSTSSLLPIARWRSCRLTAEGTLRGAL